MCIRDRTKATNVKKSINKDSDWFLFMVRLWRRLWVMGWGTFTRDWATSSARPWRISFLAGQSRCWWPLAVWPGGWACPLTWPWSWIRSTMMEKHTRKFWFFFSYRKKDLCKDSFLYRFGTYNWFYRGEIDFQWSCAKVEAETWNCKYCI